MTEIDGMEWNGKGDIKSKQQLRFPTCANIHINIVMSHPAWLEALEKVSAPLLLVLFLA